MKGLRVAALGLMVVLCLVAAAPVALAGEGRTTRVAAAVGAGDWIAGWMERVAQWLGWEHEGPRAVVDSAAGGDCGAGLDPHGTPGSCPTGGPPPPEPEGDCGAGLDPSGAPCRP